MRNTPVNREGVFKSACHKDHLKKMIVMFNVLWQEENDHSINHPTKFTCKYQFLLAFRKR
jgi:hypothetical protein